MSAKLKKENVIRVHVFLSIIFFCTNVFGQICSTVPLNGCGNLLVAATNCGTQIFCIGDSVGIIDATTSDVDSSYICWGDGIVDKFVGNFSDCKRHKYNYPQDSCVGGSGIINLNVILSVAKKCSGQRSFAGFSTTITIQFYPKAIFSLNPANVCVYEPVTISNNSCPNDLAPILL